MWWRLLWPRPIFRSILSVCCNIYIMIGGRRPGVCFHVAHHHFCIQKQLAVIHSTCLVCWSGQATCFPCQFVCLFLILAVCCLLVKACLTFCLLSGMFFLPSCLPGCYWLTVPCCLLQESCLHTPRLAGGGPDPLWDGCTSWRYANIKQSWIH